MRTHRGVFVLILALIGLSGCDQSPATTTDTLTPEVITPEVITPEAVTFVHLKKGDERAYEGFILVLNSDMSAQIVFDYPGNNPLSYSFDITRQQWHNTINKINNSGLNYSNIRDRSHDINQTCQPYSYNRHKLAPYYDIKIRYNSDRMYSLWDYDFCDAQIAKTLVNEVINTFFPDGILAPTAVPASFP